MPQLTVTRSPLLSGQAETSDDPPARQPPIYPNPSVADAKPEPLPSTDPAHRLSLSAWLLVRDGPTGLATAGTLGGSEVGVRAYFPITPTLSATARLSAPLRTSGAEASVGVALRRGPVTAILERRIALEPGGRNDFAATVVAGVWGVRLPREFRLDAYGQAGFVGRDGFADGALRIERRIASRGKTEFAVGAGAWGGFQPGVGRVDIGPQVVIRTPVAGGTLRASGEWRQRVAGKAQPASGPAITVGMDF
jgi:hypothetical protein